MTSNIVQTNQFVNLVNAPAQTIIAINTGKTHLVPGQGAVTVVTLPLPQPGLNYRFMIIGNTAGNSLTFTPSGGATVTGLCLNFTPGVGAAAAIAAITKNGSPNIRILGPAPRGTYLNMNCDGRVWYIEGMCSAVGFQ